MDRRDVRSRREFLEAMGGITAGAVLPLCGATAGAAASVAAPAVVPASEFLLDPGLTYLNTASLGPTPRAVLDRTLAAWRELETNPVRMGYGDGPLTEASEHARESAAALLGCRADELHVTRSTTDSMNAVALGIELGPGDRILTTDQEHDGGRVCWRWLARRRGVAIDEIAIAPGEHDHGAILERFAGALTAETRVVSVSHVLSSTGLRMPVREISELARARGILCVVDGAQAAGSIAIDVKAIGCHAYAASGHKFLMGPKGTGLLYVSCDAADAIAPIAREASSRFVGPSTGMGSLPLAIGLGAAIEAMTARGMSAVESRIRSLRDRAWEALRDVPGVERVGPPPGPLSTALVAFRIPDAHDSHDVLVALRDRHRIQAKMVEKRFFNGLRFSPHVFNTESDVDRAVAALATELGRA